MKCLKTIKQHYKLYKDELHSLYSSLNIVG